MSNQIVAHQSRAFKFQFIHASIMVCKTSTTLLSLLLLLTVSASAISKPTCNRVPFDEFFEPFTQHQVYLLQNRHGFSEMNQAFYFNVSFVIIRSDTYGYLILKSFEDLNFCEIFTVWKDDAGLLLAHHDLIKSEQDFSENCVLGFNVERSNSTRKSYYVCSPNVEVQDFELENVGAMEKLNVFMSNRPEPCNITMLEQKLQDLQNLHNLVFEKKYRSFIFFGACCGILLIFIAILQIIAYKID